MTHKNAVLVKYQYVDYIDSAGVSDSDAWCLIKGIIAYDQTGVIPAFDNPVLSGLFAVIKLDLDKNKKKYVKVCETKSTNGKKGGAPKGNQNARKRKQPKQPTACFSGKNNLKQQDKDLDLDLEDLEKESGGGGSSSDPAKTIPKPEEPPPPLLSDIKNNIQQNGFFLCDDDTRELAQGMDELCFRGFTFVDFVRETLENRRGYAEKPQAERHSLFRHLLLRSPNLRAEYPAVKPKRERERLAETKRRETQLARGHPPSFCECGEKLNRRLLCESCKGFFEFDEKDGAYEFVPMIKDFENHGNGRISA